MDVGAGVSVGDGVAGAAGVGAVGSISRQQHSRTTTRWHCRQQHSNTARKQRVKMARQQDNMTKIQQHNNLTTKQPIDVARRNARSD